MGIHVENLVKEFGDPPVRVLHEISADIQDGEFVAISGKSGSGKSTLLYIVSSLDDATEGSVTIDGRDVARMTVNEVHEFRNRSVGFVFQFHYLLPELTSIENVLLPARNLGRQVEMQRPAQALLERFGIGDKAHRFPSQMSGGEQQRVAIARALLLSPRYLFADEPTGNLDTANSRNVMDIFREVNRNQKTTVVLVTHEPNYAAMANREIYLIDGRIRSRAEDQ